NPVSARVMKLTIMQTWRMRCSRVKRTNWRSAASTLGIGTLLLHGAGAFLGGGLFKLCGGILLGDAQLPPHLESSGQPEQRVNATDHECPQEQTGHAPEGVEHERIFLGVVVRGVGQITGEAPGRARMALLAGSCHVRAAKVGAWIRDPKHVVSAVAVIALGRFCVAKPRDLAVIGFKIGCGNPLVAASACTHHVQPETVLIGAVDGMRGVTIVANRKRPAVSAYSLGVDAVLKLLLDAVVTLATGVRHVVCVDTRRRIASGKDLVSGVTTGASRRHGQSVLQQGSVNALGVVGDDFVLRSGVAHGSLLALAVTAGAKPGNIDRKGRGLWVPFTQDSMRAMAFLAGRGIRVILGRKLAVDAGRVQLADFIMA